ncbi:MAG: TIGR00282 family metallophosphoesterase [Erysipelotrichales bacterium]|nr:TIGR00282 family metallophosphoesterase [Erysipelotrichales bacterium]
MFIKILFIGDIFGEPGREFLKLQLPELKNKYKYQLLIINGENAAHGRGITHKIYKEFMDLGVNVITSGNHIFGNHDVFNFIDNSNLIRPLNYPDCQGSGFLKINFNGKMITIINLLGRVYMNLPIDCPFQVIDKFLKNDQSDYYFVDFHSEATSEKIAMGHFLDGRVDALVGTHTHVQTNDDRILPKGTCYITDVGMTGPLNGVIGVEKDIIVSRFLKGFGTESFKVATGNRQLNGIFLDLSDNKRPKIEKIKIYE